jgi:NAD(P)-dependent dehydrogenase (short-subunit alcohol dehydrogenase family)
MRSFTDRVAVVTGAGSGIGRATSVALSRRGCRLALADVSTGGLEETRRIIETAGGRASVHVVDVADADRMMRFPAEVLDEHGDCHILVNNAGVTSAGMFEEEQLDDLEWIVGINLWGVVYGCRAFLPLLRQADEAHIVNLSSMVGFLGLPQNAIYSLTKGGVRAFTEALRGELVGSGIGVTAVFPGAIRTNIMHSARGAEAERLSTMARSRLAPYVLRPPEVAAAKIVKAVERNRPRAIVGPDAHVLDITARVVPGRSGLLGRAVRQASSRR